MPTPPAGSRPLTPMGYTSRVHAYRSAVYNAPIGQAILHLEAVEFDTMDEFNVVTHRFTPKRAGYYSLTGQVGFFSGAFMNTYELWILLNGANLLNHANLVDMLGVWWVYLNCSTIAYLDPTDYIELWFWNNSPAPVAIQGGLNRSGTFLSIHRLS